MNETTMKITLEFGKVCSKLITLDMWILKNFVVLLDGGVGAKIKQKKTDSRTVEKHDGKFM